MGSLTGRQRGQLIDALMDAFPTPAELEMLLQLRLEKSLAATAPTGSAYDYVLFKVLESSEAEGWTTVLIAAACAARPGNQRLAQVAEPLGLVGSLAPQLERMIKPRDGVHDAEQWRGELWRNERRVCRIEIATAGVLLSGTGFLIAADAVLTNFHVIERLFLSRQDPGDASACFDLRRDANGRTILAGEKHPFATDWLLAFSPHANAKPTSIAAVTSDPARLDYALVRLANPVGAQQIGLGRKNGQRGWITLSPDAREPHAEDQILILQHPGESPLQIAVDRVTSYEQDSSIACYLTNTDEGSSGAPCFTMDWQLTALHQGATRGRATNQGIAVAAIAHHISARLDLDSLTAERADA